MEPAQQKSDAGDRRRERECGPCSLCCSVLRVDELKKLGGVRCPHQLDAGGCGIHPSRPKICRAYRCLWLQGGLQDGDRPDKLGAIVNILSQVAQPRLSIQEAAPGAWDRSPRLRAIADRYRESIPVRLVEAGNYLDPDRPFRILLANDEEQRVEGEWITTIRDGETVSTRRMPWLQRQARRVSIYLRQRKVRQAKLVSDSREHSGR